MRLAPTGDGALTGNVILIQPRAGTLRIEAEVDGIAEPIELDLPLDAPVAHGEPVHFLPTAPRIFPAQG